MGEDAVPDDGGKLLHRGLGRDVQTAEQGVRYSSILVSAVSSMLSKWLKTVRSETPERSTRSLVRRPERPFSSTSSSAAARMSRRVEARRVPRPSRAAPIRVQCPITTRE
ncbi:hypothetical protein IX41_08275 [Kocuria rhizophila]|nr:hypothetical protein IX41_08275 [Kocuria rhizophila]